MTRALPLAAVVLLLAVPAALAAKPAPFTAPYVPQDGATYFFAQAGRDGAMGSLALGGPAYDGQGLATLRGCVLVQLRPDLQHGRTAVTGILDAVPFDLDLGDFAGSRPEMNGGIATNLTVDGSLENGAATYPPVYADAAAWGRVHGTMEVKVDPFPFPLTLPFVDPVDGNENMTASLVVTRQGYRDDATHAVPTLDGSPFDPAAPRARLGGDEIHLHLGSLPGAQPKSIQLGFASAPDLPSGDLLPSANYSAVYSMRDYKFTGHASAHITATARAPAGSNEIVFTWFSPLGENLGSRTLTPALLQDGAADLDFPLDHLGNYVLRVSGKVSLSNYQVVVTQDPPKKFSLDFWWDGVTFGQAAAGNQQKCIAELTQGSVVSARVGRLQPPAFPLALVVVAAAGTLTIIMVVAKLGHDTLAELVLKKNYRK